MNRNGTQSSPSLAVVLINYNNEEDTVQCLDSIAEQSYDDFITIVVDNGSADKSFEYVRERHSWPTYLRNDENQGFTGGNNPGIEHALDLDASFILLLNNDTEVSPTFLEELVGAAKDLPDSAGIIGPKIHTYGSEELWAAGAEMNELTGASRHRSGDETQYEEREKVDYVVGAAILARAEVFEEIGLLDDDFFIYYEEAELCYRARANGWGVWYVPVSGVYHKENNDFTHSRFRDYYFSRNRWLFIQKTQPFSRRATFYVFFLVRWFLLQTLYLLFVQRAADAAEATVRGTVDALLGRTGKRA